MPQDLPHEFDPLRFARAGKQLAGQFEFRAMERLNALLLDNSGQAEFELSFGHEEQNDFYFISGRVKADLQIICQRCLGGLELHVDNPIKLGIVHNKNEADALPTDYEPLLVTESTVPLRELIEDELLLAMPIAALHNLEECSVKLEQTGVEKTNPFAKLADFKTNIHK